MKIRKIALAAVALVGCAFTLTSCDLSGFFQSLAGNVDFNTTTENNPTTTTENNQTTTTNNNPTTTTTNNNPTTTKNDPTMPSGTIGLTTTRSTSPTYTSPATTGTRSSVIPTYTSPATTGTRSSVIPTYTSPATTGTRSSVTPTYTNSSNYQTTTSSSYNDGALDVYINYNGSGISLIDQYFHNDVENIDYSYGDLLPTWKKYQEELDIKINDACSYTTRTDNDTFQYLNTNDFKSERDATRNIDLFYNTVINIEKMGLAGLAVNLKDYLGLMPNFKAFLDKKPAIERQITSENGGIYYTPYFDGMNSIERMLIMDTNIVKKILDEDTDTNSCDTTLAVNNENKLNDLKYTPFIDETHNYPDSLTNVKISKNAKLMDINIKQTDNIILLQNNSKTTATGMSMRKQLRDYLKEAFGEYVGPGKIYENLSDIFISESAAYNADELIALMRVVKASPELITGDSSAEVEILFPRGQQNNRIDNIADFMQIWGIQGLDSEKDALYFDARGKLNDAYSTKATYHALDYLSQIYDEGLILEDFYLYGNGSATEYLNRYFGKTSNFTGYGFLMYDYSASTGNTNTKVNGIGTDDAKRRNEFMNESVTGIMPVLPPLSYWGDNPNCKYNQDLIDHSNKVLMRYADSNRGLKSNSWAIPATADNVVDAIRLMDYLYSDEGSFYNQFGPEQYWGKSTTYYGLTTPTFKQEFMDMYLDSNMDFWSFLRRYVGAGFGIGHVRSESLNYQVTNEYTKVGQKNIENAILSGAVVLPKIFKGYNTDSGYGFASSVPSIKHNVPFEWQIQYGVITSFWTTERVYDEPTGWIKYITTPYENINQTLVMGIDNFTGSNYNLDDVRKQLPARIGIYLYDMSKGLSEGDELINEYTYDNDILDNIDYVDAGYVATFIAIVDGATKDTFTSHITDGYVKEPDVNLIPYYSGYVFDGYYYDDSLASKYSFGKYENSNVTIYLKYRKANEYDEMLLNPGLIINSDFNQVDLYTINNSFNSSSPTMKISSNEAVYFADNQAFLSSGNLLFDFGQYYYNQSGIYNIYFEVNFQAIKGEAFAQIIGNSNNKTGSEVFGLRTVSSFLNYRLDGGSDNSLNIYVNQNNKYAFSIELNLIDKTVIVWLDGNLVLEVSTDILNIQGVKFTSKTDGTTPKLIDNFAATYNTSSNTTPTTDIKLEYTETIYAYMKEIDVETSDYRERAIQLYNIQISEYVYNMITPSDDLDYIESMYNYWKNCINTEKYVVTILPYTAPNTMSTELTTHYYVVLEDEKPSLSNLKYIHYNLVNLYTDEALETIYNLKQVYSDLTIYAYVQLKEEKNKYVFNADNYVTKYGTYENIYGQFALDDDDFFILAGNGVSSIKNDTAKNLSWLDLGRSFRDYIEINVKRSAKITIYASSNSASNITTGFGVYLELSTEEAVDDTTYDLSGSTPTAIEYNLSAGTYYIGLSDLKRNARIYSIELEYN